MLYKKYICTDLQKLDKKSNDLEVGIFLLLVETVFRRIGVKMCNHT